MACGERFSVAVTNKGKVLTWGASVGRLPGTEFPTEVPDMPTNVVSVVAGASSIIVVTEMGDVCYFNCDCASDLLGLVLGQSSRWPSLCR